MIILIIYNPYYLKNLIRWHKSIWVVISLDHVSISLTLFLIWFVFNCWLMDSINNWKIQKYKLLELNSGSALLFNIEIMRLRLDPVGELELCSRNQSLSQDIWKHLDRMIAKTESFRGFNHKKIHPNVCRPFKEAISSDL